MSKITDARVTEVTASLTKTIETGAELFRCVLSTWEAITDERAVGATENADGLGYASAESQRTPSNEDLNRAGYWTIP